MSLCSDFTRSPSHILPNDLCNVSSCWSGHLRPRWHFALLVFQSCHPGEFLNSFLGIPDMKKLCHHSSTWKKTFQLLGFNFDFPQFSSVFLSFFSHVGGSKAVHFCHPPAGSASSRSWWLLRWAKPGWCSPWPGLLVIWWCRISGVSHIGKDVYIYK